MPDRFAPATRSKIMSRFTKKRSQIDRKIHKIFESAKVHHSMYPKLKGSPDAPIYLDILVFLEGCFWHGYPKCFRLPKSRLKYWRPKLIGNKGRDLKNSRFLSKQGWKVVKMWEHEIRAKPNGILRQQERFYESGSCAQKICANLGVHLKTWVRMLPN
jgi:DNA mismatch endonuclease (patch repair protein)